jgi:hypothetical protein
MLAPHPAAPRKTAPKLGVARFRVSPVAPNLTLHASGPTKNVTSQAKFFDVCSAQTPGASGIIRVFASETVMNQSLN